MAGIIKFILSTALLLGLIAGALVIFFADSPFVHRLIPMMAKASAGEPVEYIYLRRVKLALREHQPTDNGVLRVLYEDALGKKYDAMLNEQPVDQQLGIQKGTYVQVKQQEYKIHFDRLDRNGNGTLDKNANEWGDQANLFRFTALDSDSDSILTFDEFWEEVARDVNNAFARIDSDDNGELSRQEFIAGMITESIKRQVVYGLDADGNGAVSDSEMDSAHVRAQNRWLP